MYLYGSFCNIHGEVIKVEILTGRSRLPIIEIGEPDSGIYFVTDPVEIRSEVNDTFDTLLRHSASITLHTRRFLPELFCASALDATVNIYKGSECVFAGYIEPQTYEQEFNDSLDELTLSCIDALSALQYFKYADIGAAGVDYDAVKSAATSVSFASLLQSSLSKVGENLWITKTDKEDRSRCLYDMSKAIATTEDPRDIFSQMSISELLMLSDEEDQVWTLDQTLDAMLKYLNLHIVQSGFDFHVFSWESVKRGDAIQWSDMATESESASGGVIVDLTNANAASTDTTISVGEVFNQISLTCQIEDVENVIESPLDEEALTSPYTNRQKYMTEYSFDGEGNRARDAFWNAVRGLATDGDDLENPFEDGLITDWWLQVMNHPAWKFAAYSSKFDKIGVNMIDLYCRNNRDQQTVANLFSSQRGAALFSLGKVETKTDHKDNAPVSKIDMKNYMVFSVNGNRDMINPEPNQDNLLNTSPLATYSGPAAGSVYSPSDDETTNYIVFSGKLVLNPHMDMTRSYGEMMDGTLTPEDIWHDTVPSRDNSDGRYYTQKYWKCATPNDAPQPDPGIRQGLVPFTNKGPQMFEFRRSWAPGYEIDTVSKVTVLACMLVIGDKCVVETGRQGRPSDFEWRTFKKRENCKDDAEYFSQCFYIGFDPKIGDYLVGQEFDFQNNIDYSMGIDAEGIAIPVRKSDKLSGAVQFSILGPCNLQQLTGDDLSTVVAGMGSWWLLGYLGSFAGAVPILPYTKNILISDFEVKVYSDNGLINELEQNDLIYISDTDEAYINKKDDITFRISSALTFEERRALGVSDSVKYSTPTDLTTGTGVLTVYDLNTGETAKPEQIYVDAYWRECHKPRVMLTHKIEDRGYDASLWSHYRHPALADKKFFVQGMSRNLRQGYAELILKEINDDQD